MTSTPTPPATTEPLSDQHIVNYLRWLQNKPPLPKEYAADLACALAELSHHRRAAKSHEERARDFCAAHGVQYGETFGPDLAAEFATVAAAQREADAKIAEADRALNGRQTLSAQRIAAAIRGLTTDGETK